MEKVRKIKTIFVLKSCCLFPQFFTLLCNFMEYDSQLGNFKEDRKKKGRGCLLNISLVLQAAI